MSAAVETPLQIFPALDAATEAALRASIQRFGVLVPVTKDQHGRILDGHHRARIAKELGVEYGIRLRKVASESEAREIARTLNEDRRHMPRDQRQVVVKALKEEGHSNVAIGNVVKVDEATVRRDLSGSAHAEPDRVKGLDGKSYPASKPKQNGSAATRSVPDTPRGRQMAETAKTRVEKAVGSCNAIARGTGDVRLEWAMAVADAKEIKGWDEAFRDATGALKKLRARLKEAHQ